MPKVCAMGTGNGFLMPSGDFPEMRKGIEDDMEKAEQGYDIAKSGNTQVSNTVNTYRKVKSKHFKGVPDSDILDYGAGLGRASEEMGFDSFEPFPKGGFAPTYTDPSQIEQEYKGVISNAVLNVLPRQQRVEAVRGIGKSLAVNGKAVIMVRGRGFLKSLVNPTPYEDGVITGKDTFQKGFTKQELIDFIRSILGPNFKVSETSSGDVGVVVTRLR
jgi:hypothetical protein